MTDDVTDTWLVGVVAHDDALSSVRVHAGYVAFGPTSGRDHRLHIRMRFGDRDGGPPAFPDADTSAELIAREEAFVGAFGDTAVLVAVLTVPGFRDLVFHTGEPDACRTRLAEIGDLVDDVAEVDVMADPGWSLYRALFTDAVPADGDRRRIQEAAETGGESAPRRVVEHRFRFATLAEADQAAAALRDAGLQVTFSAAEDTAGEPPPRFVVAESEALTQVDMAHSRDALSGFAVSWGGEYEGWLIVDP